MSIYSPSKLSVFLLPVGVVCVVVGMLFYGGPYGQSTLAIIAAVIVTSTVVYRGYGSVLEFDPRLREVRIYRQALFVRIFHQYTYPYESIVAIDYGVIDVHTFANVRFHDGRKYFIGTFPRHYKELMRILNRS